MAARHYRVVPLRQVLKVFVRVWDVCLPLLDHLELLKMGFLEIEKAYELVFEYV